MAPMKWQAEGPVRITRSTIEAAWKRRASGSRLVIRDMECRGLALVVNATAMAWTFGFKPSGKTADGKRWASKSVTLGNPATLSPDEARLAAGRAKAIVATAGDPAEERKAVREQAQRERAATVSLLLAAYKEVLPTRPKLRGKGLPSGKHVKEEIAFATAAMRLLDVEKRPVAGITAREALRLARIDPDMPASARARYGAASRFFGWLHEEGHVTSNPFTALPKNNRPGSAPERQHYLSIDELAVLWKAAGTLSKPVWRDIVRLMIAVPARRGEVAGLVWEHLDLQGAVWSQPGHLTKNGEPHKFFLPSIALSILVARYEAAGRPKAGLVLPAPKSGERFNAYSALHKEMTTASGLYDWRWHDFRRSFATGLAEMSGLAESTLDAILNHKQAATRSGVLGTYQRAQRQPEQRAAMVKWGDLLQDAIAGKPASGAPGERAVADASA